MWDKSDLKRIFVLSFFYGTVFYAGLWVSLRPIWARGIEISFGEALEGVWVFSALMRWAIWTSLFYACMVLVCMLFGFVFTRLIKGKFVCGVCSAVYHGIFAVNAVLFGFLVMHGQLEGVLFG